MSCQNCDREKDKIAREILDHLSEHPEAQDTLEGIVQWWLLERKIARQTAIVREILDDLVLKGHVRKRESRGSATFYQIGKL